MIRILRIATRLNVGGPTHHVAILSGQMDRTRFQTLLVAGTPTGAEGNLTSMVQQYAHVLTVPELGRSLRPWRDIVAWWRLTRVCLRFQPDIVHTHMAKAGALGRLAAWSANGWGWIRYRRRPCRVVHTFHGHVLEGYFHPLIARGFLVCERILARISDRLIAINHSVERALRERGISRPGQVSVVPLGLSLGPLFSLNGHVSVAADSGQPVWRMGTVGRLVPIKNHALLLDGLTRFRTAAPAMRWQLDIIGDGELRPWLERRVEQLGLHAGVRFCGWELDRTALYRDLDLVCLTSNNEGSPVALIEALAAARPVIGTDVGGVAELLGASCPPEQPFIVGPRGVVVRPQDPDALAQALAWAASHVEEHRRCAQAGQTYVREHFSADRLISDMSRVYEDMVAQSSRRQTCTH